MTVKYALRIAAVFMILSIFSASAYAAEPNDYGTDDWITTWIPAAAFKAKNSSTNWTYYSGGPSGWGFGYIYSNTGGEFWAPVDLPEGTLLDIVELFYCDDDASNISLRFTKYEGASTPATTDIATVTTTGTTGCTTVAPADLNYTINTGSTSNDANYVVNVALTSGDLNHRFKGVRLGWHRQVSPAPVTATFGDVPTSHPFFQWIEALGDSGITAGCGGGNYCPDNYVTRGQMAVFLSRALGLHWAW